MSDRYTFPGIVIPADAKPFTVPPRSVPSAEEIIAALVERKPFIILNKDDGKEWVLCPLCLAQTISDVEFKHAWPCVYEDALRYMENKR